MRLAGPFSYKIYITALSIILHDGAINARLATVMNSSRQGASKRSSTKNNKLVLTRYLFCQVIGLRRQELRYCHRALLSAYLMLLSRKTITITGT